MRCLDLFSGIGGFALACEWAGIETVAFCEIDPYCKAVLRKHWPGVPIHSDVRTLTPIDVPGPVDLVCGGFPCQPYSHAGKRQGAEDDRDLWPEMLRVVREFRPAWVCGENVAGFVGLGLDSCLADLEASGYTARAFLLPALAVGCSHLRRRVFFLAYAKSGRKQIDKPGRPFPLGLGALAGGTPEPDVGRVAYGVPSRMDRLRALGNAVVPQQVYPILQAIADCAT